MEINQSPPALPVHLAVIMDGNGRWAKQRGLARTEGHKAGARAVRTIVTECRKRGIKYLTLYAFSSENWSRPKMEIAALFNLLLEFLHGETGEMLKQGIRLNVLGDLDGMPLPQKAALKLSMEKTSACKDMVLNLALNYGARGEIARAVREIIRNRIPAGEISEESLKNYLYTAGQPDPDLVIRTSGELRLSNFLLFQSAYSELYFTDTLWPDFGAMELSKALDDYGQRIRRFGNIHNDDTGEINGR